jgi:[glutamine synthetase] adenylyltransferase / [glutamine synthetase]-adenylyl-L-tyrosine phosphorylase
MALLTSELSEFIDERIAALPIQSDPIIISALRRTILASDFAFDWLLANPDWCNTLLQPTLPTQPDAAELCRYRVQRSIAQIALENTAAISIEESLRYATQTARDCIGAAWRIAGDEHIERFGVARDAYGKAVELIVFGMGKLGGEELNFSSDIDLIMSFAAMGETDGKRSLDNQEYFARITRRCAQLLSELTTFGQCYRVDLRLRPFGTAGQAALSFAAMEDYYQREGRDWERYAWIKARVAAGPEQQAQELLDRLRPFIYRRYLDFAAFEGMREMKALVDAQVLAEGMEQNLKLGKGGIREIEFLVQLEQLIRGGRDTRLRVPGTLTALQHLAETGAFEQADAQQLQDDYLLLRRFENRAQMLGDQQTHELPNDRFALARIAASLDFTSIDQMRSSLADVRSRVHARFAQSVQLPSAPKGIASETQTSLTTSAGIDAATMIWQSITAPQRETMQRPTEISETLWTQLIAFADSSAVQNLSARGRQRLDRVVPMLWRTCSNLPNADATATLLIRFLTAISSRTAYLALIAEKPDVAARLVQLFSQSPWLAQLITATPILLDELLDARRLRATLTAADLVQALRAEIAHVEADDLEQYFERLITFKHSTQLAIATQFLAGSIPAIDAVRVQSDLADLLISEVLQLAHQELSRQYGGFVLDAQAPSAQPITGFAVLGFGSLGGRELNFASDLDLVFVYRDALATIDTIGASKSIDGQRFFVRLAQRVISLLTTATRFGALYEIDMRLRPNGNKGLLVTGIDALANYQKLEAWTWEHQALVRARFIAGDNSLAAEFSEIRSHVLGMARTPEALDADVQKMRSKMRAELDRSTALEFDLKQGDQGLVDIEFELQRRILRSAQTRLWPSETRQLIELLLDQRVQDRHAKLLDLSLRQTLRCAPRIVARSLLDDPPGARTNSDANRDSQP